MHVLIAAAPDRLAELNHAWDVLSSCRAVANLAIVDKYAMLCEDRLLAAIAKAEGKA